MVFWEVDIDTCILITLMRSPTIFKYRICASFRLKSSVASLTPKGMRLITVFLEETEI